MISLTVGDTVSFLAGFKYFTSTSTTSTIIKSSPLDNVIQYTVLDQAWSGVGSTLMGVAAALGVSAALF